MNPLTNIRNITKLSQRELQQNDGKTSWHDEYRESAWIFVGGLPYDLSEGDLVAIFSQYGEPVNLNLVRDKVTGKSKGFAFVCYEDQRSTVLAVDNFNGIKILGRTIRVDHVKDYKPPKDSDKLDDITRQLHLTGCGHGVKLPGLEDQDSSSNTNSGRDREEIVRESFSSGPPPSRFPAIKYEPLENNSNSSSKRKRDGEEKSSHRSESRDKHKSKKSKKEKKKSKSKKSKSKKHKKKESSSDSSSSDDDRRRPRKR